MAPVITEAAKVKVKSARSAHGAPSQLNQSSKRGKRAWRKNVDIQDVEEGLEELRAEERVIGTTLQKMKDSDLFQIDVKGDDSCRLRHPRFSSSQLTSTKILTQRSAVPAVFSRPNASRKKRTQLVTRDEKDRLRRIAKRPVKGPLNSAMDPTEFGSGSAVLELSAAVKTSGSFDCWVPESESEAKDVEFGLETVQKKCYRPPLVPHPKDSIEVPAVVAPHQGTSYNPPVDAHQTLLMEAYERENRRLKEAQALAALKSKMNHAIQDTQPSDSTVAPGMTLDTISAESDHESDTSNPERPQKTLSQPKTRTQKNKEARHRAEKRMLTEKVFQRRLLASVSYAKGLRRLNSRLETASAKARMRKLLEQQEKLKKLGLAGKRLGKHKVPESEIEVQLGEELSETFRGIQPEGNLFRDRFLSLQQRALVEPRVLVLPKKRRTRIIEYEKHPWKRFQ